MGLRDFSVYTEFCRVISLNFCTTLERGGMAKLFLPEADVVIDTATWIRYSLLRLWSQEINDYIKNRASVLLCICRYGETGRHA